jgi:nitrate/nitrite transport system ATP-binding protein
MITHDVDEAVLLSDRIVMMTNGPAAKVGEILDVDLPRPRDRLALAEDPHYNHLRQEVLRFLYEKQRKTEDGLTPSTPASTPEAKKNSSEVAPEIKKNPATEQDRKVINLQTHKDNVA